MARSDCGVASVPHLNQLVEGAKLAVVVNGYVA